MGKYNFVVKTVVDVCAKDDVVDKLADYLQDQFTDADVEINKKNDTVIIVLTEKGTGTFYPGVMYTKNGDGYPDEWDEDYIIISEAVEEEVERFVIDHPEYEIEDWMVHQEDVDRC